MPDIAERTGLLLKLFEKDLDLRRLGLVRPFL
jgi:hypothetical protein